jgi:hypothetical protein
MSGYRQYDAQKVVHRISHGPRFVALSLSREIHHLVGESRHGLIFVDQPAQLALEYEQLLLQPLRGRELPRRCSDYLSAGWLDCRISVARADASADIGRSVRSLIACNLGMKS